MTETMIIWKSDKIDQPLPRLEKKKRKRSYPKKVVIKEKIPVETPWPFKKKSRTCYENRHGHKFANWHIKGTDSSKSMNYWSLPKMK
jgi:hypothetical protein